MNDASAMNFAISRVSLPEAVASQIEEMILNDTIKSLQRLPSEQALATAFSVSRPVIREAIMLLKAKGLVTQKNGECPRVSTPSVEILSDTIHRIVTMQKISILDIFAIRVQLEVMAIRLVAEKNSSEDLRQLKEINEKIRELSDTPEKRIDSEMDFHIKLAETSGNPLLVIFLRTIWTLLRPSLLKLLQHPEICTDGPFFHDRILSVLATGTADDAEDIIRKHLAISMRNCECFL